MSTYQVTVPLPQLERTVGSASQETETIRDVKFVVVLDKCIYFMKHLPVSTSPLVLPDPIASYADGCWIDFKEVEMSTEECSKLLDRIER